ADAGCRRKPGFVTRRAPRGAGFVTRPAAGRTLLNPRSLPDVGGDLDDLAHLRPLLVVREDVALLRRREAALRAQRELIERGELGRLVDPALDVVRPLEVAGLRRDEPEHDDLVALREMPQRLEPA